MLVRYRLPGSARARTYRCELFDVDGVPEPVDEEDVGIDILDDTDTRAGTDNGTDER